MKEKNVVVIGNGGADHVVMSNWASVHSVRACFLSILLPTTWNINCVMMSDENMIMQDWRMFKCQNVRLHRFLNLILISVSLWQLWNGTCHCIIMRTSWYNTRQGKKDLNQISPKIKTDHCNGTSLVSPSKPRSMPKQLACGPSKYASNVLLFLLSFDAPKTHKTNFHTKFFNYFISNYNLFFL